MRERQPPRAFLARDAEVDQLDAILAVDHDVFGLQIAMHHAVAVDVIQRVADRDGDLDGALGRQHSCLLMQNLAQQAALHPLHHHVDPAAVAVRQHFHDAGMIQLFADLGLALEAVEEHRVGFHLRMRDLDGDLAAVAHIGGAKNRGHAAAGDQPSMR